jgi:hypothetical protein
MIRDLTRVLESVTERRLCNTAEPSGELSAGDIVSVGEVPLAVARPAGWEPLRGSVTKVRIDEVGTHPLLPSGPSAGLRQLL